jgi:hypothetical protein
MPRVLAFLLTILVLARTAPAQTTVPAEAPVQVSVLIYGPGAQVYERFGHCGLRVRQEGRFDIACDWGVFEFTDDFILKFAKKDLRYWMEIYSSTPAVIDAYRKLGRSVTEYELDLSPEQARDVLRRVVEMNRPENKYYNYDYYSNNCATLLRDVVDASTDGQIRSQTQNQVTDKSYRWHTRRHLPVGTVNAITTALADVSMGPRVDRPISVWETMFLPVEMGQAMQRVALRNPDGSLRPLVKHSAVLFGASNPDYTMRDAPAVAWPGALLLGAIGATVVIGARRRRWLLIMIVFAWCSVGVLWSTFMLATWFFSHHVVAAWNQNLLLLSPLATVVLAGVLVRRWHRTATTAAIIIAGTSLLAVLLHLLPFVPRQANLEAILVALPINLAIAQALRLGLKGNTACGTDVAEKSSSVASHS